MEVQFDVWLGLAFESVEEGAEMKEVSTFRPLMTPVTRRSRIRIWAWLVLCSGLSAEGPRKARTLASWARKRSITVELFPCFPREKNPRLHGSIE